jgi:hypothetical protein
MPLSFKFSLLVICSALVLYACTSRDDMSNNNDSDSTATASRDSESPEKKGEYLVTLGGCDDCHTPKTFDQQGMHFDESKKLSGYPGTVPLFTVHAEALKPGNYIQMAPGINAFAGPWGVSFAANLTPDSATGLGTWTEEIFIKTLRTGRHMGQDSARTILPPMPWFNLAKAKDEDLKAIFAFLRSIPSVNNKVPLPIPPNMVKTK